MGYVRLKYGDMFEGPSDLVVIPCSTGGTITELVYNRLIHHKIPMPPRAMQHGAVKVIPFQGGEHIAQYVAYAASVRGHGSSEVAIENIGMQLGKTTANLKGLKLVAAPLLGTGAGGLDGRRALYALTTGFKSTADKDAQLVIYVRDRPVFDQLSSATKSSSRKPSTQAVPIRAFISYSKSSPEHIQWVERLGAYLRQHGIDVHLDEWHLRHSGGDLPQFMTNELVLAKRVIIVSDERYAEKADGRVGGVGWETMLIQGDMAKLPSDSTKYLVIVRSQDLNAGLPRYLKTKFVLHWPTEHLDSRNREKLLAELYDVVRIPPLGKRPIWL